MKSVQISLSNELRERMKEAKGTSTWEGFLAGLLQRDSSERKLVLSSSADLLERLSKARGDQQTTTDFIGELLDDREAANQFTADAMAGDIDLDDSKVSFLGEEITARLNEARGDQRITDFVEVLLNDYTASKDWVKESQGIQTAPQTITPGDSRKVAPLRGIEPMVVGMVSEAKATAAVIAAMKDLERADRCNRIGHRYARTHRLEQVLGAPGPVGVHEVDARGRGHVREGGGPGAGAAGHRSRQRGRRQHQRAPFHGCTQ